jgi:chaperone LolA
MIRMKKSLSAGLVIVLTAFGQSAIAASDLLDFTANLRSFSAAFTQTVYDSDSVPLQESSGNVELLRPGKFRWTYTDPAPQVIVADGATLWIYDEDIQQVTMQPQATTLGSAPIGLLSGQRSLQREFTITELGTDQGLQWFQLDPLVQDTDFNRVFLALDSNGLKAMELRDNFEQATQIRFDNFRKNVALDESNFLFVPPEGVDVVGEAGEQPVELLRSPEDNVNDIAPVNTDPLLEEADPLLEETTDQPAIASPQPAPVTDDLLLESEPVSDSPAAAPPPPPPPPPPPAAEQAAAPDANDDEGRVLQQGSEITLEVIKTTPVESPAE